jgi:hypothetical protein
MDTPGHDRETGRLEPPPPPRLIQRQQQHKHRRQRPGERPEPPAAIAQPGPMTGSPSGRTPPTRSSQNPEDAPGPSTRINRPKNGAAKLTATNASALNPSKFRRRERSARPDVRAEGQNPHTLHHLSAVFRQQRSRLRLPLGDLLCRQLRRRSGAAIDQITDLQEELLLSGRRTHAQHPDGCTGYVLEGMRRVGGDVHGRSRPHQGGPTTEGEFKLAFDDGKHLFES